MAKGGLGAGLDLLFNDNTSDVQVKKTLRLSDIEPNRDQPRKTFSDEAITALAESIREHGVLQPILVRPLSTGGYQIVAGERRWRASQLAGLKTVPCIVRNYTDREICEIAIIENLQREDLNPIESARAIKQLIETFDLTQEVVADRIGKSRPAVANTLRLLTLTPEVVNMIEAGKLSAGHARCLISVEDPKFQVELALKASP